MRLTVGSSPATYLQHAINCNALLDVHVYLFNCIVMLKTSVIGAVGGKCERCLLRNLVVCAGVP